MDRSPLHVISGASEASPSSHVIEEDSFIGGEEGSPSTVGSETDNNSHVDVDGPEVLPCSASSSSSSPSPSQSDVDVCTDETSPSASMANRITDKNVEQVDDGQKESSDTAAAAAAISGGRLRFFLAGRCVLELAHDTDGDGRPKQWTQTSSKSYYPRPATWIPSTVVRERRERKISPCSGTPESALLQRKKPCYNGSYFPFAMLRHSSSSHFSRDFQISRDCLRRAARNPLRPIAMKSPVTSSDCKTVSTFSNEHNIRKRFTFTQRAERLFRVIESLPRCISVSPVEDIISVEGVSGGGSSGNSKLGAVKLQSDASSGCDMEEQFCKGNAIKVESGTTNAFRIPSKESSFCRNKFEQIAAHSKKWPLSDNASTVPQLDDTPPNTPKKLKKDVCNSSVIPDEAGIGRWPIPCLISPSVEPTDQRFLAPAITIDPPRLSQPCAASNPVDNCLSPSILPVESTSSNRGVQKKRKRGAYGRGRTIGEAVRNFVIREILDLGGDLRTKCVPRGVFTEVGLRYKVDATTTYRWWLKYCNSLRSGDVPSVAVAESSQYVRHGAVSSETSRPPIVKTVASNSRVHSLPSSGVENSISPVSCNRELSGKYQMTTSKRKEKGVLHSTDVPLRETCVADSHSPQSNDSQSSSTSIVDPASLYASFVHANIWPQHLPLPPPPPSPHPIAVANGSRSLSARLPPLPVGICFPYVWNQPRASSSSSVNRLQGCPTSPFNEKGESESMDEPLDLTLPKKCAKRDDLVNGVAHNQNTLCYGLPELHRLNRTINQPGQRGSSPNSYSEWRLEPSVLKTNICDDRHREKERSLLPSTSSQSRHSSSPLSFHETSSVNSSSHSLPAQRYFKPRHYPFMSLQIGTFEIHSKMYAGYVPNKFKVIFTKRKFVYEFETTDERREASGSQQMACIVVPFSIVEGFWCSDRTIVFRVGAKPSMFVGHRHRQIGVPSLTVYETKKPVDLTGGQLAIAHLHKVTLLKPHLVERLKVYLVLFDVQFRNVSTTTDSMLPVHDLKEGDVTE